MRPEAARALARLEALSHEDLIDDAGLRTERLSRARAGEDPRRDPVPGLGRRRLSGFAVIHALELADIAASLAGSSDREARAVRGRALRLSGRMSEARAELAAAARADAPRAASWLGEALLRTSPARAERVLAGARASGDASPACALWLATALLARKSPREALALLEEGGGARLHSGKLLRVQALLDLGRPGEAARAAREAALDDPGSARAFAVSSWIAARDGEVAAALRHLDRARDLDLEVGADPVLRAMGVRVPWQDPRGALAALGAALARRPRSALLLAERAEMLRHPAFCDYAQAERDLRRAARLAPRSAWVLALHGRALNQREGGASGLREFDRAARLAPLSGWIRAWRGALLARLGERGRARSDFDEARRLMPTYPFTYAWSAALRLRARGAPSQARRELDIALALEPEYVFSRVERAKARLSEGDLPGVLEDLLAAYRADPKHVWHQALAPGGPRAAAADLLRLSRRRPDLPWLSAWRGHSLLEAGRPAQAREALRAAARRLPREAEVLSWLGKAEAAAGDLTAAERALAAAARLSPGSWAVHAALAQLHALRGAARPRLRSLRRACRLAPTTVSLRLELADAARRVGREAEALAALDAAGGLDAASPAPALLRAEILLSRGDAPGALAASQEALARGAGARALLLRSLARGAGGDRRGQARDLRDALRTGEVRLDPAAEREYSSLLAAEDI